MQDFAAKTPNIPIPFHRLLKVVALVDAANPQVAALLERLRAENIEVEVSDRYSRDVSEDSDVGAYVASVDGARREHARTLGKAIRDCGFTTPLWALADSSRRNSRIVLRPDAGLVAVIAARFLFVAAQSNRWVRSP